jgi:hypothetical protein
MAPKTDCENNSYVVELSSGLSLEAYPTALTAVGGALDIGRSAN